jgi:hypothetical protein
LIIKIIFWGFSCQNLKFGIKYRNKSSISAAGGTDQSYYGTYPAKRMKRSARQMKDRDLMVYLMKENIKLREKLRETEETSDYWFQEYRELKKRNEK